MLLWLIIMTDIHAAIVEDHDLILTGLDAALQRCACLGVVGDARNGIQVRLLETAQPSDVVSSPGFLHGFGVVARLTAVCQVRKSMMLSYGRF
jgi:DNA-binding NarL/FixJ family response regulator